MRLAAPLVLAALLVGSAHAQAPPTTTTSTTTAATTTIVEEEEDAPGAAGTELSATLAQDQVTVSSDYRGTFVTVIGVSGGRGDIVVALRGPNRPAVVMRKRRVAGLWVNGDPVRFSAAPSFHAVLSNRPLREIASPQAIWALQIDPAASARLGSAVPAGADPSEYREALVRLRRDQGLYPTPNPEGVVMRSNSLFRAVFRLPANAPIARYNLDAYHFRNGRLVASTRIQVPVERVGIERRIHDLAVNASVFYGLITVLLALGAGWMAAFAFRRQ